MSEIMYAPLGNRVVVNPSQEAAEMSAGGIVIPDTAKEKPQEGEVIAVGPGRMTDSGERIPVDIAVGDTVVYPQYVGDGVQTGRRGVSDPRRRTTSLS